MSILNSASSQSVYRGYEYYKTNKVISSMQISDYEYEGYVQGSNKEPYYVVINTKHPKKSSCDCPVANGNTICKHMVCLFFAISPEELKDYEDWYENDYEDEYDEYEDYYENDEYYEDYSRERVAFVKPIFFEEILKSFVDGLSEKDAKKILIELLEKEEKSTFNTYLKDEYKKYTMDKKNIYVILEKLNKKTYQMSRDYDYNYKDYTEPCLSKKEKEIVETEYVKNEDIRKKVNRMFLNPELATYDDYLWFAKLYKKTAPLPEKKEYIEKLGKFFDTLKHYSIKNTIPKSNVLITIDILNGYDVKDKGKLLVEYCKYPEYMDYIINNAEDRENLYISFKNYLEEKRYVNYENIANVFYKFYLIEDKEDMYNESIYYTFLNSKDIRYLRYLQDSSNFDYYINRLSKTSKDVRILECIYIVLDQKEKLIKLLLKEENERRLFSNIEILKDEYNEELLQYLRKRFFETIDKEKNRDTYHKACYYIEAICKLNNGNILVELLVQELKESEYSNRRALFDEINLVIKNKRF